MNVKWSEWSWPVFVVLSTGPALLAGISIMLRGGAPWWYPVVNGIAFAAGLSTLALPALVRGFVGRHLAELSLLAVLLLLTTMLDPGIDGVHRWAQLGPLRLHPSAVLSPLVVLGIAQAVGRAKWALAFGLVAGLQGVHMVQPDAGQSSAVALGVLAVALLSSKRAVVARSGVALVATATCLATWIRPDPLPAVKFVEDVLIVGWSLARPVGAIAAASLSLLSLGPWLFAWRGRGTHPVAPAVALGAYMAASCAVAAFGNYPVPLVGYGGSPVLGAVLGFGALGWMSAARRVPEESDD